ncbi:MAG: SH3 domain-containing protein [Chloroflexia bacterium]
MRSEPSTSASEVVILPDGTRLVEIGPGRNADGRDWLHVKVQGGDNDGKEGWVAAEFTSSAP